MKAHVSTYLASSFLLLMLLGPGGTVAAAPVTFQVNMALQSQLGNFTPGADAVEVRGSFDSWGPGVALAPSQAGSDVYTATVDVPGATGTAVQYKFVINREGTVVWENNGVGPNGAQNRTFNLSGSAQTLPLVYFNNQSEPAGPHQVTFQVDLGIQRSMGNFDPTNHTVEAHGSFDSWGPGIPLSPTATNANVYQGAVEVTGSPGANFEYKYVINKAGTQVWEGNVGSGGGFGNRTFTLTSGDLLLPVAYFDNIAVDPGAGIPVTFTVNMAVLAARGPFVLGSPVTLAGPFNNWDTSATPLTNSTAEPNLYRTTINIKSASGATIPFKFLADGTWETGDNRTFTLQGPSQTLPVLFFNNQPDLGALSITRTSANEVTVSWTVGANVKLQSSSSLVGGWQDVPNSLGGDTMTFPIANTNVFFRLTAL